jgi:hypothetical protein
VTAAASAAATATPRLVQRYGNRILTSAGCAAILIGTAWMSRLSASTGYLTGLLTPMVIFGLGQGIGLSTLTTAGLAGVEARDAGVAGGLVNVFHHIGGAFCLGILITLFAATGAGQLGPVLLADRVSVALTGAAGLLALALLITLIPRPTRHHAYDAAAPGPGARAPAGQNPAHPGADAFAEHQATA